MRLHFRIMQKWQLVRHIIVIFRLIAHKTTFSHHLRAIILATFLSDLFPIQIYFRIVSSITRTVLFKKTSTRSMLLVSYFAL